MLLSYKLDAVVWYFQYFQHIVSPSVALPTVLPTEIPSLMEI